jgi:hypothetical protein
MNFASIDIRDSAKSNAGDGNPKISTPFTLFIYTVVLMQVQIAGFTLREGQATEFLLQRYSRA